MASDRSTALVASRNEDEAAFSQAFELAYGELRRIARRQLRRLRPGQTLTTTSLVHEAFLKLVQKAGRPADRAHLLALASRAMRQVLVDSARKARSLKHGGGRRRQTLEQELVPVEALAEELVDIDQALTRLEVLDARLARVVEWRFFGGMSEEEVAEALGTTARTVRRDWRKARALLHQDLSSAGRRWHGGQ
jgi:RNA polymerase sigma factor (TIGR02999 family)